MTLRWFTLCLLVGCTIAVVLAEDASASCSCVAKDACTKVSVKNTGRRLRAAATNGCSGGMVYCCGENIIKSESETEVVDDSMNVADDKEMETSTEMDTETSDDQKFKKKINVHGVSITGMRKKPKYEPRHTARKSHNVAVPVIKPISLRSRPNGFGKYKKTQVMDETETMSEDEEGNTEKPLKPKTLPSAGMRLNLKKGVKQEEQKKPAPTVSKLANRLGRLQKNVETSTPVRETSTAPKVAIRKFPPRAKLDMSKTEPNTESEPTQSTETEESTEIKADEPSPAMAMDTTKDESAPKQPVKEMMPLLRIRSSRRQNNTESEKSEMTAETADSESAKKPNEDDEMKDSV